MSNIFSTFFLFVFFARICRILKMSVPGQDMGAMYNLQQQYGQDQAGTQKIKACSI